MVLSRQSPWGTEENHENPQDSRSPGRDFNPGPPDYEAGVLTNRPRRSVYMLRDLVTTLKRFFKMLRLFSPAHSLLCRHTAARTVLELKPTQRLQKYTAFLTHKWASNLDVFICPASTINMSVNEHNFHFPTPLQLLRSSSSSERYAV
jgi:hypothetical protein